MWHRRDVLHVGIVGNNVVYGRIRGLAVGAYYARVRSWFFVDRSWSVRCKNGTYDLFLFCKFGVATVKHWSSTLISHEGDGARWWFGVGAIMWWHQDTYWYRYRTVEEKHACPVHYIVLIMRQYSIMLFRYRDRTVGGRITKDHERVVLLVRIPLRDMSGWLFGRNSYGQNDMTPGNDV